MTNQERLPNSTEESKYIEVEQDEWLDARPGSILKTTGVDPCIVLAIYCPGKGAILGHFSDPMGLFTENNHKSFNALADLLNQNSADKADWTVWIGGGAGTTNAPEEYDEMINSNIKYVHEKILSTGISESRINFGLSGNYEAIDVEIDSNDGSIKVEVSRSRE